jgi:hypothetical protein
VALQPEIQLLPNGDILAPIEGAGGRRVFRVSPEDQEYPDWLAIIQAKSKSPGLFEGFVHFLVIAALVYFGVGIGIFSLSLLVTILAK